MRFNPTRVPWLVVCGSIGAAIGYLGFGRNEIGDATLPALYGLLAGTVVGMIAWVASIFWARKAAQNARDSQGSSEDDSPPPPPKDPA